MVYLLDFVNLRCMAARGAFHINMVSLIRKIVREFFKTKVFLQISDRFFHDFFSNLKAKGLF